MVSFYGKDCYDVNDLYEILVKLRGPGGCPWDREQTHESIRRNFIEEAYEAAEAIDSGNPALLQEELGDVLLQVVFHARIAEEAGRFNLNDVADGICKKLIFRHPHIFGTTEVSGSDEVLHNWDALKRQEKGQRTHADAMDSVARNLPATWRAEKIQKKAKKAGFDWHDVAGAMDKLREEVDELGVAVSDGTNIEEELGDLLFAAVNVARFVKVDAEQALHRASDKFAARFRGLEELATQRGLVLEDMSLAELDALWDEVKQA